MPPPRASPYLDRPFADAIGNATHVEIRCNAPRAVGSCGNATRMLARELAERCAGAITYRQVRNRLRCSRCGSRGWASITALER